MQNANHDESKPEFLGTAGEPDTLKGVSPVRRETPGNLPSREGKASGAYPMTNTSETIVINTTKEFAEAIRREINAQTDSQSHLTERRNLDGNIEDWILIVNLTVQALRFILEFIKNNSTGNHVKKIKVGNLEIENPTPADLQRLRAIIDSQLKTE